MSAVYDKAGPGTTPDTGRTQQRSHVDSTPPERRSGARLPRNWRARLPYPSYYFRAVYAAQGLSTGAEQPDGWRSAECLFCDEGRQSMRLHRRGVWRCDACNRHGDLVDFHQKLTGFNFVESVRDIIGLDVGGGS